MIKENKYIADQREWYKPGRIIFCGYWRKCDKVLDFQVNGHSWLVTVVECDKEGKITGITRTHATSKGKGDKIIKEA